MAELTDEIRRARALVGPWPTGTGHPVRVEFGGEVIARTTRGLRMLETSHPPTYYMPPVDVRWDLLARAPGASMCEWKDAAAY